MRFTINLTTRTYLNYRRINQVVVTGIVLLLALLAWNVSRVSSGLGELHRFRAESAEFESRLSGRPAGVSENDYNKMLASIRFFNAVIERKSFSWLGLLEQLENATPEGIALTSLSQEKKKDVLKIEGVAKNFGMVRAYMEKLGDSKGFVEILLLSHKELLLGEKTKGVQFSISCRAVTR
jgi:type IV pilus assembly protein PilN